MPTDVEVGSVATASIQEGRIMSSRKDAAVPVCGLRVDSFRDGDTHVVVLEGELDLATVEGVERELERAGGSDARSIVVDLRKLDFMDCSGLRVIWAARRRAGERLILVRGPGCVQRVFEISGLVRLLAFVDEPPKGAGANRFARQATRGGDDHVPASDRCGAGGYC
jgi:anti-anti-sigma factor